DHPIKPDRSSITGRVVVEGQTVSIPDASADAEYTAYNPIAKTTRKRSALGVPLIREGEVVGVFVLWRDEVRPFGPRETALVETFADQAVIAIENVRLFNETKEGLERQTASAAVLRSIADKRDDVRPVLQTLVV